VTVSSLVEPDAEAARELLADGLAGDRMCTVVGRCEVDYDGRTTSYLGTGDRLVVLKPDGTLLVHTAEQRTPVNWQPPGCDHAVAVVEGGLLVESERSSPAETVEIRFGEVYQVSALALTDEEELELAGSEADLRDRVLADPDLIEAGFDPLATERRTPAGAVDIYGEDAEGNAVAVELKRRRVGPDAVGQLARYVEALERDLHADATVRGLLVAPSVTDRAGELLAEKGLEFVSLEPTPETAD
jgi:RecB family endonuclease NucS